MHRFIGWTAAAITILATIGCSAFGGRAESPCERCDYGYIYVGKRAELRKWCRIEGDKATCCIKDGKIYDCSKNPPECPECAKAHQEK